MIPVQGGPFHGTSIPLDDATLYLYHRSAWKGYVLTWDVTGAFMSFRYDPNLARANGGPVVSGV